MLSLVLSVVSHNLYCSPVHNIFHGLACFGFKLARKLDFCRNSSQVAMSDVSHYMLVLSESTEESLLDNTEQKGWSQKSWSQRSRSQEFDICFVLQTAFLC